MKILAQFAIGLLFGLGLVVSGMANPAKVLNFLDLSAIPTGGWDASLALVMGGAVLVTFAGYRAVWRRGAPVWGGWFHLPALHNMDARLVTGPAIFGAGWGLAGFCPGPAFVAVGTGSALALLFTAAMVVGMGAARWLILRPEAHTPMEVIR